MDASNNHHHDGQGASPGSSPPSIPVRSSNNSCSSCGSSIISTRNTSPDSHVSPAAPVAAHLLASSDSLVSPLSPTCSHPFSFLPSPGTSLASPPPSCTTNLHAIIVSSRRDAPSLCQDSSSMEPANEVGGGSRLRRTQNEERVRREMERRGLCAFNPAGATHSNPPIENGVSVRSLGLGTQGVHLSSWWGSADAQPSASPLSPGGFVPGVEHHTLQLMTPPRNTHASAAYNCYTPPSVTMGTPTRSNSTIQPATPASTHRSSPAAEPPLYVRNTHTHTQNVAGPTYATEPLHTITSGTMAVHYSPSSSATTATTTTATTNNNSSTSHSSNATEVFAYCYQRAPGQYTRLVPVDMLPPLRDIPATEPGQAGMVVLDIPRGMPPEGCPSSNFEKVTLADPPAGNSIQTQIDTIVANSGPVQQSSQGPRRPKIYCDKWIHDGVCAFTQQGCKYKHEMPMDRETQHFLGLFHGLPGWWRKRHAEAAGQQQQQQHYEALPEGSGDGNVKNDRSGPTSPTGRDRRANELGPRQPIGPNAIQTYQPLSPAPGGEQAESGPLRGFGTTGVSQGPCAFFRPPAGATFPSDTGAVEQSHQVRGPAATAMTWRRSEPIGRGVTSGTTSYGPIGQPTPTRQRPQNAVRASAAPRYTGNTTSNNNSNNNRSGARAQPIALSNPYDLLSLDERSGGYNSGQGAQDAEDESLL